DRRNEEEERIFRDLQAGYRASAEAAHNVAREVTEELLERLLERRVLLDEDAVPEPRVRSGDQESDEQKAVVEPLFGAMDIAPPPVLPRRRGGPARPAIEPGPRPPARPVPARPAPARPAPARPAPAQPAPARAEAPGPGVLIMRPYPARGGTQVQVPIAL